MGVVRRMVRVVVALAIVIAGLSAPTQSASATTPPTTLHAGQVLTAETANDVLQSTSPEYALRLYPEEIGIYQTISLGTRPDILAEEIWHRYDMTGDYNSGNDRSTLKMQTDGNLVLRTASGHVLWASNTARTGSSNYVTMQSDGNLVIYTPARKVVWASHTTAFLLPAGQRLGSGKFMTNRQNDQFVSPKQVWTLSMQTDGNLVYRCNAITEWQTKTHVANSYLSMQTDGNLVLRSPAGKPLWASNTQKLGSESWFDVGQFAIWVYSGVSLKWQGFNPYDPHCG